MYWLCVESYRASGRPSRFWVVKSDTRPDMPDDNGERAYPFNDMGGSVLGDYNTEEEANDAINDLTYIDHDGLLQWC